MGTVVSRQAASLLSPGDLAIDGDDNVFVKDEHKVRRVDAATGVITTVAGTGVFGSTGDGGLATDAQMAPQAIAVGPDGTLYVADANAGRVRSVEVDGLARTVAGGGSGGDGGPAVAASLAAPMALAVGRGGQLFIVDSAVIQRSMQRARSAASLAMAPTGTVKTGCQR